MVKYGGNMDLFTINLSKAKMTAFQKVFPECKIRVLNSRTNALTPAVNENVVKSAVEKVRRINIGKGEMGVVFESGFFHIKDKGYFFGDVCCIKDKEGYRIGFGLLYEIPKSVYLCAKRDVEIYTQMTKVMEEKGINYKLQQSVVGFLTDGRNTRSDGYEMAASNALEAQKTSSPYSSKPSKLQIVYTSQNQNFKYLEEQCANTLKEFSSGK